MGAPDHILETCGVTSIAIVGCSKNSGKTTTLNNVLACAAADRVRPGLLSIGIDGEEADFWLGVPKPRIAVRPGFLVATSDQALAASTARVKVIARTDIRTPLGEVVVAGVEVEGDVLLAGVRHKADVRRLSGALIDAGATRVVIDGAYQRIMAADPDVSDAIVLATGAVLGRTVREVVRRTADVLARFVAPVVDTDDDRDLLARAVAASRIAIRPSGRDVDVLAFGGASPDEAVLRRMVGRGDATLAVPGALTARLAAGIAGLRARNVRLVATDPSRVFASAATLAKLRAKGGDLRVGRGVRLLAVTVNPVSVFGHRLPEAGLVAAVSGLVPGVPVFATTVSGHGRRGS